jgi:hypothetical protein
MCERVKDVTAFSLIGFTVHYVCLVGENQHLEKTQLTGTLLTQREENHNAYGGN